MVPLNRQAAKESGEHPANAMSAAMGGAIGFPTSARVPAEWTRTPGPRTVASSRSDAGDLAMLPVQTQRRSKGLGGVASVLTTCHQDRRLRARPMGRPRLER